MGETGTSRGLCLSVMCSVKMRTLLSVTVIPADLSACMCVENRQSCDCALRTACQRKGRFDGFNRGPLIPS